jgi:feruloyl esterase
LYPDPDNLNDTEILKSHLKILQKAVLDQCDEIDGVKDNIINDPALSANATIEYYEAVKMADPSVDGFLKLFLLPGANHCGGGPGPSTVDWIEIIRDWVENRKTPERIILTKFENDELIMTRPVYPFPGIAVYVGFGDPNVESSYIE